EEIDNARVLRQAVSQKARGVRTNPLGQGVEHGEPAQREAGVVEVGTAFTAGEAAVGVLGGQQEAGVPLAHRLRETGQAVGQLGVQVLEVTHGKWPLAAWRAGPAKSQAAKKVRSYLSFFSSFSVNFSPECLAMNSRMACVVGSSRLWAMRKMMVMW